MAKNTNNYFIWRKSFTADDRLTATTRLVLHAIHVYMDDTTLECYPNRPSLARDTGLSMKTISIHTEQAEKLGWLKKFKAKQPGNQFLNNIYKGIFPTQGPLYSPKREPEDLPREPNGPRVGNEGNTNYPENYLYNSYEEDSNEKKIKLLDVGRSILVRESQVKTKEGFDRTIASLQNWYTAQELVNWVFKHDLSEVKTRDELKPFHRIDNT